MWGREGDWILKLDRSVTEGGVRVSLGVVRVGLSHLIACQASLVVIIPDGIEGTLVLLACGEL